MNERQHFEKQLSSLRQSIVTMMNDVADQYKRVRQALELSDKQLAHGLIAFDEDINQQEIDINERVLSLIIRENPVASDLRMVMTAIKIANDLERIADYACNIAKYLIHTHTQPMYTDLIDTFFPPIFSMFEQLSEAYINKDLELALSVAKEDEKIDDLFEKHVKTFIRITKTEVNTSAEEAARAILVVKQLERTGDHLTNIAEAILYLHKATHVVLN